jgi:hypothetical protein
MALPALTHRRLATVNAAGLTIAQVLDAIWAGVDPSVTTYSDGSTRTFSGSTATGWTWTRVQVNGVTEAVYASPPGGTMNQRVVLAGRSAAPTPSPVVLGPESFTPQGLLLGMALEAGAFTTWNAGSPFTSGYWSGYTRLGQAVNTMSTSVTMTIYESQETIVVQLVAGGTAVMYAGSGAWLDPETSAAAAAENDGRRYCFWTSGTTVSTSMLGSSAQVFVHSTSAGQREHTYVKRPGGTTTDPARRCYNTAGMSISEMTNLAGELALPPLWLSASSGWAGRLRECCFVRGMLLQQTVTFGGSIIGLALAPTTNTTGDCLLLKY